MLPFLVSILAALRVFLRSRNDIALEVLALRQQVAVLKRKRPRPHLHSFDRLFWTTLRPFGPVGLTCWLSSSQKPSSVGIGRAFAGTGGGGHAQRGGRPKITEAVD